MAVSTRKRFEVFKRDAFTCQYCGRKPPDVTLHVDHVVPSSRGGADGMENLVTSCATCNLGKSAVPLAAVPAGVALPADIAEKRKQLRAYMAWQKEVREYEAEQLAQVESHWAAVRYPLRDAERRSLPLLIKTIGVEQVLFAMDLAISRGKPFRYACGVMWNIADPSRGGER